MLRILPKYPYPCRIIGSPFACVLQYLVSQTVTSPAIPILLPNYRSLDFKIASEFREHILRTSPQSHQSCFNTFRPCFRLNLSNCRGNSKAIHLRLKHRMNYTLPSYLRLRGFLQTCAHKSQVVTHTLDLLVSCCIQDNMGN